MVLSVTELGCDMAYITKTGRVMSIVRPFCLYSNSTYLLFYCIDKGLNNYNYVIIGLVCIVMATFVFTEVE